MKTTTLLSRIALLLVFSVVLLSFTTAKGSLSNKISLKQQMTTKGDTVDPTGRTGHPKIPNPRVF